MELVSVADIIFAVDEPMDTPQLASKENGDNDQRCTTFELWTSLNRQMIDFLDSVSLRDLVDQQRSRASQTPAAASSAGLLLTAVSDAA
jgi:Rrf2 family iron-sulfur cluster assembly transcriptional regulator